MKLDLKKIKYQDFLNEINNAKVLEVKKKRERAVYYIPEKSLFFKTWVQNWTQSEITDYGIEAQFYNQENADSLVGLLYDESGPRGYIQRAGESAAERGKSDKCWDYFVSKTSETQRREFMSSLLKNSILARGTYTDLAPCNIIFYNNKINFIDFESFRSFKLIFEGEKEKYENFDLDAWWKPLETARRDVNKYISEYFKSCLDIELSFKIDSEENLNKALSLMSKRGSE